MATHDVSSRQQCLDELDNFISTCQQDISDLLDTAGWTAEYFVQPRQQKTCHFNSDHRMTAASLEKHETLCSLITQGLTKEDAKQSLEDQSFFYRQSSCVYPVKLDLQMINSVLWNHHNQNHSVFYGYKDLPRTSNEEEILMTREDRRALAEYIINRAKEANRLKELGQDEMLVSENLADLIKKDTDERKLDHVEEMAALRDFRRRRQTYRAKNVHITKKSHTEIMREVINNQMEMYAQSIKDEQSQNDSAGLEEETQRSSRERDNRRSESHSRHTHSSLNERSNSRSTHSPRSRSQRFSRPRSRSRSYSDDRESGKHRHHKERHRSRSRSKSGSRDRAKKHKHKKSKHKKSKKSKKNKGSDQESDGSNT